MEYTYRDLLAKLCDLKALTVPPSPEEKGGKEFALNHPEEWNKKAPKPEQHKKLNLEEMQKKVKEDAPKRESRRNSVREPAKRAEIEKTEHGVNDVMTNNKSVMPGRRK